MPSNASSPEIYAVALIVLLASAYLALLWLRKRRRPGDSGCSSGSCACAKSAKPLARR